MGLDGGHHYRISRRVFSGDVGWLKEDVTLGQLILQ